MFLELAHDQAIWNISGEPGLPHELACFRLSSVLLRICLLVQIFSWKVRLLKSAGTDLGNHTRAMNSREAWMLDFKSSLGVGACFRGFLVMASFVFVHFLGTSKQLHSDSAATSIKLMTRGFLE